MNIGIADGDELEFHLSRAELFFREGEVERALRSARRALLLCADKESSKAVALRIFVAKCYCALGEIEKSNAEYRALIDENNYLPPIIMGLMHNNLLQGKDEKVKKNMQLVKIFTG